MKTRKTVMAPVACCSGCAGESGAGDGMESETSARGGAVATASLLTGPTHCRKAKIKKIFKRWKIFPVTALDDFVNKTSPDHDYSITDSWHGAMSSTHSIEPRDRMHVYKDALGRVFLRHTGDHSGTSIDVTTEPLVLEHGLWAKGVLRSDSRNHLGTFYLYKLEDEKKGRHPNSKGVPSRCVHFEYFDAGVTKDLPCLPGSSCTATVFPIDWQDCNSGQLQTDDGDGDEGLR